MCVCEGGGVRTNNYYYCTSGSPSYVMSQAISGPRQPDNYEVSINLITTPHQQINETVHPISNENYIVLTLNNSLIQPNNIYIMNITASNPAGGTVIIQNWKISKLSRCQDIVMLLHIAY